MDIVKYDRFEYVPSFDRDSTSSPNRCMNEPIVRLSNSGLFSPPCSNRNNSERDQPESSVDFYANLKTLFFLTRNHLFCEPITI